jgi:pimeloyl-ACP methyl ester carboxylesterase
MIRYAAFIFISTSLLLSACSGAIDQKYLIEKYTTQHSKFMSLNDGRIHYRDEGEGEVVVLLHGTASSLHTWDQWLPELSKQYRVIRMDLPGFGLTGPDLKNRYEIADDIVFLKEFLTELNIDRVHLVGSSLGGRIAWEYSLAHPTQVKSLTLMNSLGYSQASWPPAIEMAQWPLMDTIMAHISPRFMYETGLKEVYFNKEQVTEEVVDRYYELSRYSGNLDAFPRRVRAKLDTNEENIKRVSAPTLILWGREDIYFPVENAFRFHQDIQNSQIYVYSGVGHLPMEEDPSRSLTDFQAFIHAQMN